MSDGPVMRAHKYLKEKHPLAYEAAQIITPVGIAAAALEGVDAVRQGSTEELVKAGLSAFPVTKGYKVGKQLSKTASEALGSGSKAQKAKTLVVKAAAGENVAEAGEAGYRQGETFKKGGSVKGWGKARGGRKCKVY